MNQIHKPVLLSEVLELLRPQNGRLYVDATLGFGGHTEAILEQSGPTGRVIGIDQDEDSLEAALKRLAPYGERFSAVTGNFSEIDKVVPREAVDGAILADIGVSSYQLDRPERGFSFRSDGPLDMRMNRQGKLTAEEVVNTYPEAEIAKVLRDYGEERFAARIARKIVEFRKAEYIKSTCELADIVSGAVPKKFWKKGIHPVTKTFQAIRIEVNNELGSLEEFLPKAVDLLQPEARLAVITFHSLEDRIVKDFFRDRADPCTCPKEFPKCICGKKADIRLVNKKPITATEKEKNTNPRSRSAKLRVIEKIINK